MNAFRMENYNVIRVSSKGFKNDKKFAASEQRLLIGSVSKIIQMRSPNLSISDVLCGMNGIY